MDPVSAKRLFGFRHAFDSPVTLWITIAVVAVLIIAAIMVRVLHALHRTDEKLHDELVKRVNSWAVMTPLLLAPVLLGAAWTILAVAILSVLCYREFARATGFFRYRSLSIVVVLGIIATTFAIADHWYGLFVAIPPLTIVFPRHGRHPARRAARLHSTGRPRRDRLPVVRPLSRPSQLHDERCRFSPDHHAHHSDRRIERRVCLHHWKTFRPPQNCATHQSEQNTRRRARRSYFNNSVGRDDWPFCFSRLRHRTAVKLIGLGLIVSIAGQFGDLMLSSIKRDIGIKDMGATIPGHGGFLDRFDSLLLVSPAVFHYVAYFRGFGLDQPTRIFSIGG